MHINLTGKNILVTGASSGIGKAIAEQLANSGARVAIHYNKNKEAAEKLASQIGNNSAVFKANLENKNECRQLFADVISSFNHIDVLVNNAGVSLFSQVNDEDKNWDDLWDKTMKINLDAVGILCREAIKHFTERNEGRIITIASRASFRGDTPEYLAYAASKGGLVSLSRSIARGYGKKGIKAFLIAPGFVETEMAQDFINEYGKDYVLSDLALPTLTQPENISPFVVLLASGLGDHATGCTIDINAGSYVH
jgi:NAD(P)-dependent dehydrogenase (short-subunit alcohol dehydrogenase family)